MSTQVCECPLGGAAASLQLSSGSHRQRFSSSVLALSLRLSRRALVPSLIFFPSVPPVSEAGEGPLQLGAGVGAEEDVEERVQQGVEAGQAVAQPVNQKNGPLQSARLVGQQQGHEPVAAHQVVGPEHHDEVDGDHDQDADDFVPPVVGEGRRASEGDADVGRGVA